MENIVTVFPNDDEVASIVSAVALRSYVRVLGNGFATTSHIKHLKSRFISVPCPNISNHLWTSNSRDPTPTDHTYIHKHYP